MNTANSIQIHEFQGQAASGRSALSRREVRVVVLLLLVIAMSALDFLLTSHKMTTSGMAEANPIVVMLMNLLPSTWALFALKSLSTGVYVEILYRARHRLVGEIGAWIGVAILIGVSAMWVLYLQIEIPDGLAHAPSQYVNGWVVLK